MPYKNLKIIRSVNWNMLSNFKQANILPNLTGKKSISTSCFNHFIAACFCYTYKIFSELFLQIKIYWAIYSLVYTLWFIQFLLELECFIIYIILTVYCSHMFYILRKLMFDIHLYIKGGKVLYVKGGRILALNCIISKLGLNVKWFIFNNDEISIYCIQIPSHLEYSMKIHSDTEAYYNNFKWLLVMET